MTDQALMHRGGTSVAIAGAHTDPYSSYGAKVSQEGTYLAFSKGEYLYGTNKDELALGTKLVANMPELRIGWRCWVGGKVIDDRTELLMDMLPVVRRDELGDLDKGLWELDDRQEPRDPWVLSNILELHDPDSGETYIFSATSKGGIGAIGKLCKEYGKERRMRGDALPFIELKRDSYMHSNKAYGKIYVPLLPIVGWTEDGDSAAREPDEDEIDDEIPF